MADFVIQVVRYDHLQWDYLNGQIQHASGTAWLVFQCHPFNHRPPFWQVATVDKNLDVVETVKNGAEEDSLSDAQRVDSTAVVGATVAMKFRGYDATPRQISQA